MAIPIDEIRAVDAFLVSEKALDETLPIWVRDRSHNRWVSNWPIVEAGDVRRSKLCFHVPLWVDGEPSATLVFRGNTITQVDLAPVSVRKPNPPWSASVNASPFVDGNHWHPWALNREHVLRHGRWELPVRESIAANVRSVAALLNWLAPQVGLIQGHGHHSFEGPTRADLFEGDAP